LYLDLEVLDDLVCEQPSAHFLHLGPSLGRVLLCELQLDELALTHILDAREPEGCQRMLYRLALGIEHTVLQGNMHARFHLARYLHAAAGNRAHTSLRHLVIQRRAARAELACAERGDLARPPRNRKGM